jgi:AraC-like DNA-binding protein
LSQSYVERAPLPELAGVVRTVWAQRTGDEAYVQRHLPTGGAEIHWPIGGEPRVLGPLTGPVVEVIPARTTIVGVRFRPGCNPFRPAPLEELLDRGVGLRDLGLRWVDRVGDAMASAATPGSALALLQSRLWRELGPRTDPDPLVGEAVRLLMPWHPVEVGGLATRLGLSASQLRRRCLQAAGTGPKTLQRTLRFQGFLALAQAGAAPSGRRGADGMAGLAVDVGYADQSHLTRECVRLTGVTPRVLLGGEVDRCLCGHEHAASYRPFLATRGGPPLRI